MRAFGRSVPAGLPPRMMSPLKSRDEVQYNTKYAVPQTLENASQAARALLGYSPCQHFEFLLFVATCSASGRATLLTAVAGAHAESVC